MRGRRTEGWKRGVVEGEGEACVKGIRLLERRGTKRRWNDGGTSSEGGDSLQKEGTAIGRRCLSDCGGGTVPLQKRRLDKCDRAWCGGTAIARKAAYQAVRRRVASCAIAAVYDMSSRPRLAIACGTLIPTWPVVNMAIYHAVVPRYA